MLLLVFYRYPFSGDKMTGTALSFITNLKKLCNHPQLILEKCQLQEEGFEGIMQNLITYCLSSMLVDRR